MPNRPHSAEKDATACPEGHDRRAGRWCGICGQYGSHHTDRHGDFTCCIPPVWDPTPPEGGYTAEDF